MFEEQFERLKRTLELYPYNTIKNLRVELSVRIRIIESLEKLSSDDIRNISRDEFQAYIYVKFPNLFNKHGKMLVNSKLYRFTLTVAFIQLASMRREENDEIIEDLIKSNLGRVASDTINTQFVEYLTELYENIVGDLSYLATVMSEWLEIFELTVNKVIASMHPISRTKKAQVC